jgi:hypothetical protein
MAAPRIFDQSWRKGYVNVPGVAGAWSVVEGDHGGHLVGMVAGTQSDRPVLFGGRDAEAFGAGKQAEIGLGSTRDKHDEKRREQRCDAPSHRPAPRPWLDLFCPCLRLCFCLWRLPGFCAFCRSAARAHGVDGEARAAKCLLDRLPGLLVGGVEGEDHRPPRLQRLADLGEGAGKPRGEVGRRIIADRINGSAAKGLGAGLGREPGPVEKREVGVGDEIEIRRVSEDEVRAARARAAGRDRRTGSERCGDRRRG